MLAPIPVRSNSRETYLAMRAAILSGELPPDLHLRERDLAAQLGVSRTPVREALAMLEAEELVISTPNKGTIVRRVSAREIRETYEVRAVLEGHCAGLAAGRMTSRKLGHLRRLNRDMKKALERSYGAEDERVSKLAELNAEFHKTIARLSGNEVLHRTVASLIETPLYARAYFWYADQRKKSSIDDHDRMIELLEGGELGTCEEFWRGHLYRGRDYLIDYLEAEGEQG